MPAHSCSLLRLFNVSMASDQVVYWDILAIITCISVIQLSHKLSYRFYVINVRDLVVIHPAYFFIMVNHALQMVEGRMTCDLRPFQQYSVISGRLLGVNERLLAMKSRLNGFRLK